MSSPVLFVIVGKNEPLFEAEIDTSNSSGGGGGPPGGSGGGGGGGGQQQSELSTRQNYFVLHSALDLVEKSAWTTNSMYLRVVDKVNQQQVSTFLTAANVKFMLLHGGKGEEVIKNFFNEVYGYYVKVCMCLNAREALWRMIHPRNSFDLSTTDAVLSTPIWYSPRVTLVPTAVDESILQV
jgi:hypothetical protein